MALIPVKEFKDWDYSRPSVLHCKNHPDLTWYWKGPGRNLHFSWTSAASNDYEECKCSFDDLVVVVEGPDNKPPKRPDDYMFNA